MLSQLSNKAQRQSQSVSASPVEFAERKIVFLDEIRSWVEDRRAEERLSRKQIGELDGLGRLQAQRRSLLDNMAHFYARHSNADAAPGVLILITFYSDNNDGCCSLSVARMAKFLSRSDRRISDAISRLQHHNLIVVEPVIGKTSRLYPWVHKSFGSTNDPLTWILELRAPPAQRACAGRRRNTPDASVTPVGDPPDAADETPLTPVTNTPDAGDQIPLSPASPNTTNKDTTKNTTEVVEVESQLETLPRPPSSELLILDVGSEVAIEEATVSAILTECGILNPTHAQSEECRDTLTKAALQWQGMNCHHSRYKTALAWFRGEWLKGLKKDLRRIEEQQNPKRFKDRLDRTIMIEAKASPVHYGSEPKVWSTTPAGANNALDQADKKYFGGRLITNLIDFENGKLEARSQGQLPEAIAKAALKRLHGDDALDIFPAEQQALEKQLADDGFHADDVKRVLREFSEHVSLGLRKKHRDFPANSWALLFQRETFIERALAYLRAALRRVQDERETQHAAWLRRLPETIAGAEARKRNPDPWKNWKTSAASEARDALVAYVMAGLGIVSEDDIPGALLRANALAEQFVQTRGDESVKFQSGTEVPTPPEPFEFQWHKIDAYPDPFANSVSEVAA